MDPKHCFKLLIISGLMFPSIGRWVAKLVARLLATAYLWVQIWISLQVVANKSIHQKNPYDLGLLGSGSVSQKYASGSFFHLAKIVRKTLIPTVLWLLFDFLSLKNDVNIPSKSISRKTRIKISFLLASWMPVTKIAGAGSGSVPKIRNTGRKM